MGKDSAAGAAFDGAPPPSPGLHRFYPILRAHPGCPVLGVVINPTVHGVWCHFADGHTVPCGGDAQICRGCRDDEARRWYGYLAILEGTVGRICLAEVSAAAVAGVPELQPPAQDLRGLVARVERLGQSRRARLKLSFQPRTFKIEQMPRPLDIAGALRRLWGSYPVLPVGGAAGKAVADAQ